MSKKPTASSECAAAERRSPCPVACTLDLLGDRWTLLVVRDLFLGRSRFKDFVASPEGIPTNLLSDRLERLVRHGVVDRVPASDGSKRLGYQLTDKGRSLGPVLEAMRDWGLAWEPGAEARMVGVAGASMRKTTEGHPLDPSVSD